jgi:hypothetical protein
LYDPAQLTAVGQAFEAMEALAALERLDEQARNLERRASGPSVEQLIATEDAHSQLYCGRTVLGIRK